MMEKRVSKLNDYFNRQIAFCEQCNKKMLADDRRDEAVFEKIKANIYDIFRTILSAAVKTGRGDPEAVKRFFILKIEQISSTWAAAYNEAGQHDDGVKMQIEQIKIDTAGGIREKFLRIWEEEE